MKRTISGFAMVVARDWAIEHNNPEPLGWLYFIEDAENGRIKIGRTQDPLRRLALMNEGKRFYRLLGAIPSSHPETAEAQLKARYEKATAKDWYVPTKQLVDYIVRNGYRPLRALYLADAVVVKKVDELGLAAVGVHDDHAS